MLTGGFILGASVWKILNIRQSYSRVMTAGPVIPPGWGDPLVYINETPIRQPDIDFEIKVLTAGLKEAGITATPETPMESSQINNTLEKNIIDSLVERKMLYQIVKQDKSFSPDDPARHQDCLANWIASVNSDPELFASNDDQQRLKARLCEQGILKQYLEEKVFFGIQISGSQIADHYRKFRTRFFRPTRVIIRQIVLADEKKARKIKFLVTRSQFARIAAKNSITPEAENGGLLPSFSKGYSMPRFFDVAFAMKPGQISSILKSTYGFHIIMLEKRIPERYLTAEEAAPLIRTELIKTEREKAYQKWVDFALHSTRISTPGVL